MNAADMKCWRAAGAIAARVRDYVVSLMRPGASLLEVSLEGHRLMEELGGRPAFPLQISRNSIAAHYCAHAGDQTVFAEGDLAKVDCGVHVDGFVADTAASADLSRDGRHAGLLAAAREALDAAVAAAGPGVEVVEIGRAVERAIQARGYQPIRNLTGHGVARWTVHEAPQIPNVSSGKGRLRAGSCVALEPFATDGGGSVSERGEAHVFMAKKVNRRIRGADPRVVEAIRAYNGLPFGSRDLVQRFPYKLVAETLNALARANRLVAFPPLCEKEGRFVSQFEHTIHVSADGVEILTLGAEVCGRTQAAATAR
ncbi:MAG: type II methionyl aminopeptidase [Planctomycetes bacterium]|nr:type II methionyl aminopeptidase [Planctomycetota bacterium]